MFFYPFFAGYNKVLFIIHWQTLIFRDLLISVYHIIQFFGWTSGLKKVLRFFCISLLISSFIFFGSYRFSLFVLRIVVLSEVCTRKLVNKTLCLTTLKLKSPGVHKNVEYLTVLLQTVHKFRGLTTLHLCFVWSFCVIYIK